MIHLGQTLGLDNMDLNIFGFCFFESKAFLNPRELVLGIFLY